MKTHTHQEFKCNKCPGFFVVRLNRDIKGKVLIVCPVCGREHQRDVIDGVIKDEGKTDNENKMQKIRVAKSAFSKEAKTKVLKKAHESMRTWNDQYRPENRNGVPILSPDDLVDPAEFYKYQG